MSYESPIHIYKTEPMIEQLRDKMDNLIVRAVANVDVQVDRDELIKALEYDRGQYEKGFLDGRMYMPPNPTNADRIRAMTDEELAEYIDQHTAEAMWCESPPKDCPPHEECMKCILDWLKQEVTE